MARQHIQHHHTGSFLRELGHQFYHLFDRDLKPKKISQKWEIFISRTIGTFIIVLNLLLLMIFHQYHPETPANYGQSIIIGTSGLLIALPFLRGIKLGWVSDSIRTYWIFFLFICYITGIPALLFLAAYVMPGTTQVADLMIYILLGSTLCWLSTTFSAYHLLRAGQETERTHYKASMWRMLVIIFWLSCFVAGLLTLFVSFRL